MKRRPMIDQEGHDDFESERASVLDSLKTNINALLWTNLPPHVTLGQAEEIAVEMYRRIEDLWWEPATRKADDAE